MNFNVIFSNSTYLLLLIPAFVLALLLFFKADKFHRSVGNRFLSSILHLCIMALAISLLAGIAFEYDETDETEVILLVFGEMDLFEALCHSFGTTGTGGFGIKNSGLTEETIPLGFFDISQFCSKIYSLFFVYSFSPISISN